MLNHLDLLDHRKPQQHYQITTMSGLTRKSQSPTDLQTLDDLQAPSAAKDDQIARLTRAAESKTDTIMYLDRRNKDLKESVRTAKDIRLALDPQNL